MYLANWEAVFFFFDVVTTFLCRSNARLQRRRLRIAPAAVGCKPMLGGDVHSVVSPGSTASSGCSIAERMFSATLAMSF
jgi:hypothetical protein